MISDIRELEVTELEIVSGGFVPPVNKGCHRDKGAGDDDDLKDLEIQRHH